LEDHARALYDHTGQSVDIVVFANDEIPEGILQRYREENAAPILIKEKKHDYKIVKLPLLSYQNNLIRHDAEKVREVLERILN